LANNAKGIGLGGEKTDATVLFSDLRGFTKFSESRTPEEVVEVLNKYLGEMTNAIMGHGGTLVSFMGDGIMAVFGAPIAQADHADRALAAAIEMHTVRLKRFNTSIFEGSEGFQMGIGLNSGLVLSGMVGSDSRVEYTAIGDTTNTASRLEGMTKGTPYQVFIAESTRSRLTASSPGLQFVDRMQVPGRDETVEVWTLSEDDTVGIHRRYTP
jgi:adenylate cyclase